jgi:predicted 2-oxoglutarate/Fe(II)-dependent dioxygenase YbiX
VIGHIPQALSPEVIDAVNTLYSECNNSVVINTNTVDRHWASTVGHFLITEFTAEEFAMVWENIKTQLANSVGAELEYVYGRVLKYNKTCYIPSHVDTFDPSFQKSSDISVLVGLNEDTDYAGGDLIIEKTRYRLTPGDAVYYTYEHPHEVTPIRKGVRKVINLRCRLVK